mgnify:CR=1 FL=1
MHRNVKIAIFLAALIAGSLLIEIFGRMFIYYLVMLTGWGWLFPVTKGAMLGVFWVIMVWKFWPKKTA